LKRTLVFFALFLFILKSTSAQNFSELFPKNELKDIKKSAPVIVNGDKVEYLHEQNEIVGTGNININYGDVNLTCDKIIVRTDTKVGICEGNVKITQPGGFFEGEKIEYNFAEKTGSIVNGTVRADPIYGHADRVEKVSEKKVVLDNGYITTCDRPKPHYRVRAKQIRLYLDDKVIAKHVFFYIGNFPVIYIPYYVQPIRDVKTKITVIPGHNKDWGYYVLGAYRYYLNEKCKGFIRLDYREKKGLGEGVDYSYNLDKLGEGTARFYYTQENNRMAIEKTGKGDDRWRVQYKHSIDFTNDTKGMLEFNKLSDKDIVRDYFYREYEEGMDSDNYVSVITTKPNYSFKLLARKRFDDFLTVTERLPEASLQVHNQRLGNTFFYYFNELSFTNFVKRYEDFLDYDDEESMRLHTYNKLSYAFRPIKGIYATPYAATRQTYYTKNRWDDDNIFREIYEYGLDISTKFYKVFDVATTFMDINKLRHIITPTVGFFHRHQPSVSPVNLFQFDTVDSLDYENKIILSLENKLQTKRPAGGKAGEKSGEWKSVDLLRFIVSTDYEFRLKKGSFYSKGDGAFTDIKYELELSPYDWLFTKADMVMDTKDYDIRTANFDIVCDTGGKLEFGAGYRYERSETGTTSQFTMDSTYKVSKDWAVRAYERFDIHDSKWIEQEYTIYKDLHCWLSEFTFNLKDGDYGFWVILRLKAFPDVPFGLRRTYHRPSPGSM